jgi:hypothetical protein
MKKNFLYWACATIALITLAIGITLKVAQWNVTHKSQFTVNGDNLTVTALGETNTYDLSSLGK